MSVSAVTAIPLSLISTAQQTLENSDDYYLATKHYVDTKIKTITDKETVINSSLSSVITEISEIHNFSSSFKVSTPDNVKPDRYTGIATIGTIVTPSRDYTLTVNVSDYARVVNPEFKGTPMAPTAGEEVATRQIATTAFVARAVSNLSAATQPYSPTLLSIAQLNASKDKMLYTTANNIYATTDITSFARTLLSNTSATAARNTLGVAGLDGTGARGTWDITAKRATTATTATNAVNDSDGHQINITYAKLSDIEVSNTLSQGTRIGTIKFGNVINKDINVDFSGYAPINSPAFTGIPTAVTAAKNDDSEQIATTAFVTRALKNITGNSSSAVNNFTITDIYNAIGGDINFSTTVINSISGKQDKSDALTSIANLDTSANKMIYTIGKDIYNVTPLTGFARELLGSNDAADARDKLNVISKDESSTVDITVNNSLSALISVSSLSSLISISAINDEDGNQISTSYVKIADLHNMTSPNHLGWASFSSGKTKATSLNSLAYWDGRYDAEHSNLVYCKVGKFGDIITHNVAEFVTQENITTIQNSYNYSLSNYLTISEADKTYLSIENASSLFLSKTEKAATAALADKAKTLNTVRKFYVSDKSGDNTGDPSSFDGSSDITIKLPDTVIVNLGGEPTAPTPIASNNSTRIATTAFVQNAIASISIPDVTAEALTASSSNKLTTPQLIDGFSFDGTAAISRYCVCNTAASTALKTVTLASFSLVTGARITVNFVNQNTAANPQLSVSGTAAKFICYRGRNIPAEALRSNATYDLVYNGTTWDIVGSLIWTD